MKVKKGDKMKNKKRDTKSIDDRPMNVVLFIARNKDNKHFEHHSERRHAFITKEPMDSGYLMQKFNQFVQEGLSGEVSRFYYSVNDRDEEAVYKELLRFLIDNPDFNLCTLNSKLARFAAMNTCAKTKRWMFDFDIDDSESVNKFCKDIKKSDGTLIVKSYKTPNGYAVVVNHGFDTRELMKTWPENVTLKRDDLLCYTWSTKL